MAAPSGTTWGNTVGSYGRIGLYTSLSSTDTQTKVTIQIWFWSKYSVSDSGNTLYYDNKSASGSASTSRGSVSISTTVDTGSGWSTSNQKKLKTYTATYDRAVTDQKRYLYAKLAGIDRVGGTMYVNKNITIPKLASYTVSYNANGGTGAPSNQTKWHGVPLTLSDVVPTRDGYAFNGWGSSATATTRINSPGGTYDGNSDYTYYAIWVSNAYTITYNANGGTGAPASQTKTHGQTLTLSSTKPTRTGYDFQGWGTSASDTTVDYEAGASYTGNAALNLYAIWKQKMYTVTYNANGGTGAPASQTKTHDAALTLSTTIPTRSNYIFKGWSNSATSSIIAYKSGASYTSNANITLYAVWEIAYKNPTISSVSLDRCDATGALVGNEVETSSGLISFTWSTFNNVSSAAISWVSASGEISGSKPIDISGTSGTVKNFVFGNEDLPMDQTFTIVVTVTDSGGSTSRTYTLEGYLFPIDMLGGGNGVAFGKPAEFEGIADFKFEVYARSGACLPNDKSIVVLDTNGNRRRALGLSTSDNLLVGYDNYINATGNTNVFGHDIHHYVSNIATPSSYRPYRRQGDTLTISSIRVTGYVTNSGKEVRFFVPISVPILGSPTISVASVKGFVLIQNGNYTHGSSGSTYITPDSYGTGRYMFHGISITATFSNTTNAINNSPIGIIWDGTITFS